MCPAVAVMGAELAAHAAMGAALELDTPDHGGDKAELHVRRCHRRGEVGVMKGGRKEHSGPAGLSTTLRPTTMPDHGWLRDLTEGG